MTVSPFAGKPAEAAMLVNVPRLVTAYYTGVPDPAVPARKQQAPCRIGGLNAIAVNPQCASLRPNRRGMKRRWRMPSSR